MSLCAGVMHNEDGYDVFVCERFQCGIDGDKQKGLKSNVTLLMRHFAGKCAVVQSNR